MNIRIIPRLDIKGPNLVKGVNFEGLRVLGAPRAFARHYSDQGADELFYQDAVASLYGRNSLLDMVRATADEIFIPLTVGGGLRSVEDIRTVLRAGADKVALNTAVMARPELISEAARSFGSSTVVVAVEAQPRPGGGWDCFTDYGREATDKDAVAWARQAVELGAGELVVTSIAREGTGQGFDLDLTREIATQVPVPVIAAGGAGNPEHIRQVVEQGKADAVCLASMLHYDCYVDLAQDMDDALGEGNRDFLAGKRLSPPSRITPLGLPGIKAFLAEAAIPCRPAAPIPLLKETRL